MSALVACAIVGLTVGTDATAGEIAAQPTAKASSPILKPLVPSVHGTVDMAAAVQQGNWVTMTCDKLEIVATSVAMKACPPGGGFCVPTPKWVAHSPPLKPTAKPGVCSYAIPVPAGKSFGLGASSPYSGCGNGAGVILVDLKPTASTGPLTVPAGTSKEADLVVAKIDEECLP